MRAIAISPAWPRSYVSFHRALNLRRGDEFTGDWHALTAWFRDDDDAKIVILARRGSSRRHYPRSRLSRRIPCGSLRTPGAVANPVTLDPLEARVSMIPTVR